MGKYIIELERGETAYKTVNSNGKPMIQLLTPTPYTEPDTEKVREEAYEKGFDAGRTLNTGKYEKGLNDAWEAARKIANMPYGEEEKVFGSGGWAFIEKHTASEAIEKIRQYEQEKEEYHIGDEVIRHYKNEFMEGDDTPSIFLSEEDGHFRCLAFNGRSIMIAEYPKNQYRKTGRHFPEIAEVLKKMRESE